MSRRRTTLNELLQVTASGKITQSVIPAGVKGVPKAAASGTAHGKKGIGSVETAFRILEALEASPNAMTLGAIAAFADLTPSATHHYLVSLSRIGAVKQLDDGRYDLGGFALQLGLAALGRIDSLELARTEMEDFRATIDESIFFSVWGNRGPTIVRWLESSHPLTVEVRVGLVLPVVRSATGTVFLAWLPEAATAPYVRFERSTTRKNATRKDSDNSFPDIESLKTKVRKSGFGETDGALLPNIAALAVPVFGTERKIAGVLTAVGWRGEFDLRPDGDTLKALRKAASNLSRNLGYRD